METRRKERLKKTYGRLQAQEYKKLIEDFRQARINQLELERYAAAKGNKIARLLQEQGAYWWVFYELPFPQHLALMLIALGWKEKIIEISKMENPVREFLQFAGKADDPQEGNPFESMEEPQKACFINLLLGIFYSMEAIGYFGLPMNTLVEQAATGNKEALLRATSIDRCVMCTDAATSVMANAQLTRNKAFFTSLFKRIKSPHAGRRQYLDLRYLHTVLEESQVTATCSPEEILELVGDKLRLYPIKSGDPVKGLSVQDFALWDRLISQIGTTVVESPAEPQATILTRPF